MSLSNEDVQDILALLDSLPYGDVTLETSRLRLRLRRAPGGLWTQETELLTGPVLAAPASHAAAAPVAGPQAGAAPPGVPAAAAGPVPAPGPAAPGLLEIRAPLPGTFYRAPQPGAPPFVEPGGLVAEDTVVAIIETMKLMNPVYAGISGTVSEICLPDGEFAPQHTVLMRVRAQAG